MKALVRIIGLGMALIWVQLAGAGAAPLDRILAVVEGLPVTQSEVADLSRQAMQTLEKEGATRVDPEAVRKRVLEELIQRRVIESRAVDYEIKVDDKDVDAMVAQVEQGNNLAPGTLPQAMARQGLSYETFRKELRGKLVQSRLIGKMIRPLVSVSDEEVRDLHQTIRTSGESGVEELHLGHILIALPGDGNAQAIRQAKAKTELVVGKLNQGSDFRALASAHSDDDSALKGGDMGWFKRGQLMPELDRELFGKPKGALVGPLRSPQGIHIFKILDKRGSGAPAATSGKSELKVSHILFKVLKDGSDAEEIKQRLLALRQELDSPEAFAEAARQRSQDDSADEGGSLGWFATGTMTPEFEKSALTLGKGEISQPVRTPFGWHLILLEDKRTLMAESLPAQWQELERRVLEAKVQARFRQWLRDERKRAFVEYP